MAVPLDLAPRYNIAPTQPVAAVRYDPLDRRRRFVQLRWGLVPAWAQDASIGSRMINARAETVHEKPAFRTAFRRRRCLVLADGYFEWQKSGRAKQPYYIHFADGRPFAFAALWERWSVPESAGALESCTIITTEANALTRPIHDRMPVILRDAEAEAWLDPERDPEFLRGLLVPLGNWPPMDSDSPAALAKYGSTAARAAQTPGGDAELVAEPVSPYVNNPRNDGPQCVALDRRLLS